MAMSWLDRARHRVRADAHGGLDAPEDRTLVLEQQLRDAKLELESKRALLSALGDEEERLRDRAMRLEEALEALDADMHLALAREREDLARFAIRRIIPQRRDATSLGARIQQIGEERKRLAILLESQQAEFDQLRARDCAHIAERASAETLASEPHSRSENR